MKNKNQSLSVLYTKCYLLLYARKSNLELPTWSWKKLKGSYEDPYRTNDMVNKNLIY